MESVDKLWKAEIGPGVPGVGYNQGMAFVAGTGLLPISSTDSAPSILKGAAGFGSNANVWLDASVTHDSSKDGENVSGHEVGHFEIGSAMAYKGTYGEQFADFVRHYCCPSSSYTYFAGFSMLRDGRHMNHLAARFTTADLTNNGETTSDTSYNGGLFWAFFVSQFGRRSFYALLSSNKLQLRGSKPYPLNEEHSVEAWGVVANHVGMTDTRKLLDLWLRDTLTLAYLRRDAQRMAGARKYFTNQKKAADNLVDANLMWTHCNTKIVPLEPFGFAVHDVAALCAKAELVEGTRARVSVVSPLAPANWVFVLLRCTRSPTSTYEMMSVQGGTSILVNVPAKGTSLLMAIAHNFTGAMKGNRLQVGPTTGVSYILSAVAN
jgi:hypothetical protein